MRLTVAAIVGLVLFGANALPLQAQSIGEAIIRGAEAGARARESDERVRLMEMQRQLLAAQLDQQRRLSGVPVLPRPSAFTGSQYLHLDGLEQRRYVTGLIDGMRLAPLFGALASTLDGLEICTANLTDRDIAAVLNGYLYLHKDQWSASVHTSMYAALSEHCK